MHALKKLLEENGGETRIYAGPCWKRDLLGFFSRWFSLKHYIGIRRIIKHFRADIVHMQNCSRRMSPSPAVAARHAGVPVVMTVHDNHCVCPKTAMIFSDQKPCSYSFGFRCLLSSCYPNAPVAYNWVKWFKVFLHRILLKRYVDLFICPSRVLTQRIKKSFSILRSFFK